MSSEGDTSGFGKTLDFDEFTVAEIQAILSAVEMISHALGLTDGEEDFQVKVRISTLVFECAENGERDLKSLVARTLDQMTRVA
jgi:hypothetical protein